MIFISLIVICLLSDKTQQKASSVTHKDPCSNTSATSFLENGNCIDPLLQISSNGVAVLNTCAFDAFSELITNAYHKNIGFRNFIDAPNTQEDLNYFNFISIYHKEGPSSKVYNVRAKILCSLFTHRISHQRVDCKVNLHGELLPSLLDDVHDSKQLHVCELECKGKE